jgi:hypothetical protein
MNRIAELKHHTWVFGISFNHDVTELTQLCEKQGKGLHRQWILRCDAGKTKVFTLTSVLLVVITGQR